MPILFSSGSWWKTSIATPTISCPSIAGCPHRPASRVFPSMRPGQPAPSREPAARHARITSIFATTPNRFCRELGRHDFFYRRVYQGSIRPRHPASVQIHHRKHQKPLGSGPPSTVQHEFGALPRHRRHHGELLSARRKPRRAPDPWLSSFPETEDVILAARGEPKRHQPLLDDLQGATTRPCRRRRRLSTPRHAARRPTVQGSLHGGRKRTGREDPAGIHRRLVKPCSNSK